MSTVSGKLVVIDSPPSRSLRPLNLHCPPFPLPALAQVTLPKLCWPQSVVGDSTGMAASGSDGPASGGAAAAAPAVGGVGLAAGSGLCQRYMPAAGPRREAPFLDCEEPEAEEPTQAEVVEELSRQARITQHWERFLRRALRLDHHRRCWAQQGQWLAAIRCRGRGHSHHLLFIYLL